MEFKKIKWRELRGTSEARDLVSKFEFELLTWIQCLFSLMIVWYFCQSADIGRILISFSCWTLSDLLRQNLPIAMRLDSGPRQRIEVRLSLELWKSSKFCTARATGQYAAKGFLIVC